MTKTMFKPIWTMAWYGAMMWAMATRTKADDNLISALGTDEMFEEFWQWLVERGWVKNTSIQTKTLRKGLGLPEKRVA